MIAAVANPPPPAVARAQLRCRYLATIDELRAGAREAAAELRAARARRRRLLREGSAAELAAARELEARVQAGAEEAAADLRWCIAAVESLGEMTT